MYPAVSAGKPYRESGYQRIEVEDCQVYLDTRLRFEKAVVDYVSNRYGRGLRIVGVRVEE